MEVGGAGTRLIGFFVPALAALLFALALAPPANAANFYSNFAGASGSRDVGGNQRLAQPFVAAAAGDPLYASFPFAITDVTKVTQVSVSIYSDVGGQPGVEFADGTSVTVDDTSDPGPTCTTLTPQLVFGEPAQLVAGEKYWAVFQNHTANAVHLSASSQGSPPRPSSDGVTWGAASGTPLAVSVDDTSPCIPDINPNPAPGVELGDMYANPGGSSFQTLFVSNNGNTPLTLTATPGGPFTGPSASMFSLLDGEPNGVPPGKAFKFPKTGIGPGVGGVFLYIACKPPLDTPDGMYTATFTLTSNDPDEGSLSWPVWCLIDHTPPSLEFPTSPDGRAGWFVTRPAPISVRGVDPESGDRVIHIFCTDNGEASLDWRNGSVASFGIQPDGIHALSCKADDLAGNTTPGTYDTTVKVDGTPPETTNGDVGPPAVSDDPAASFSFAGSDATSGLGEFECRLDGGAYELCTSPASRSGLGNGTHTFEVRARDVAGNYDPTPTQWTWDVNAPAPQAADDSATTTKDGGLDIDVLANDIEPRGVALHVELDAVASEMGGTTSIAGSTVHYQPPAGFSGTDRFSYRAVNANGVRSAPATVTVQVEGRSGPGSPASAACDAAKARLAKAKAKLRKLKKHGAPKKAIKHAKAKVKKRRKAVKAACAG